MALKPPPATATTTSTHHGGWEEGTFALRLSSWEETWLREEVIMTVWESRPPSDAGRMKLYVTKLLAISPFFALRRRIASNPRRFSGGGWGCLSEKRRTNNALLL